MGIEFGQMVGKCPGFPLAEYRVEEDRQMPLAAERPPAGEEIVQLIDHIQLMPQELQHGGEIGGGLRVIGHQQ